MNLQAEKLELLKLILDSDDKSLISEVKSLFKSHTKKAGKDDDLQEFYQGFENGIKEVKASLNGTTKLRDAQEWLNEL